jgi:uncharacterized protein YhfF
MRDRLNARILQGTKVATAGLWQQDYLDEGESIEKAGDDGNVIATVEITRVETHRFAEVPWEFADAEGEDFQSIEQWREGHTSYFAGQGIEIDEGSLVVCVWLRLSDRAG